MRRRRDSTVRYQRVWTAWSTPRPQSYGKHSARLGAAYDRRAGKTCVVASVRCVKASPTERYGAGTMPSCQTWTASSGPTRGMRRRAIGGEDKPLKKDDHAMDALRYGYSRCVAGAALVTDRTQY